MDMRQKILDCTLRDGGYVNDWNFGKNNIKEIIESLVKSNIDIIELGYLTEKEKISEDRTLYTSLEQINDIIPINKGNSKFVVMINAGEYNVDKLPEKQYSKLDGIRVAFHKENIKNALNICRKLKNKGYMVFVQPMVIPKYSDIDIINLINETNELGADALYIVDSFGSMDEYDVMRIFMLYEHNLYDNISIGLHSHNNLQLSFSNAQIMLKNAKKNKIIVDSTFLT